MSTESVNDWSDVASSNTDVNGVSIAEGCPPSNVNDAMREIMASVKLFGEDLSAVTTDKIQFNTNPTVGSYSEGKLYYDKDWKTLSANIDTDVNLQIGLEDIRLVYNNTGSPILNGQAVYTTGAYIGAFPYVATVSLAVANDADKYNALGLATQNIPDGSYGVITVRGSVNDLNTSSFNSGDVLWLSETTPGALQNSEPTTPGVYKTRIGRCMFSNSTTGAINVRIFKPYKVEDLSNVIVSGAAVNQVLTWNGTSWVNGNPAVTSASSGVNFYNASPTITATGNDNSNVLLTLSKTPVTTAEHTITSPAFTTNTVISSAWLYDTALGLTTIPSGTWKFSQYISVSSVLAGRSSTFTRHVYSVLPQDGGSITVTITGTGTSRTATASGGTPFATTKIAASATNTTASFLQTPKGLYQITARTSDTVVTITVPTTYTNESGVTFNVWKKLFGATSIPVTNIGTNYGLYDVSTTQGPFTITTLHKLGSITFCTGTAAGSTTMTSVYDGTSRNSFFASPFLTKIEDLPTSLNGIIKGNGTAIVTATAGTDYSAGTSSLSTGILKSTTTTGALSIATGSDLPLVPTGNGGTGVANGTNNTITFTGNYTLGLTLTGNTAVTFPTSGTLVPTTSLPQGFFRAYASDAQSISAATATKVSYKYENFDVSSWYDKDTDYRYTPQKAGYYYFKAAVYTYSSTPSNIDVRFYKNGSAVSYSFNRPIGNDQTIAHSDIIYMNGSTDYLEVYVYSANSFSLSSNAVGGSGVYFEGYYLGA